MSNHVMLGVSRVQSLKDLVAAIRVEDDGDPTRCGRCGEAIELFSFGYANCQWVSQGGSYGYYNQHYPGWRDEERVAELLDRLLKEVEAL